MNILIIIPARGGSKGIPRKNLRSLGGTPLIGYAINTALRTSHQADVYVTSEDEEILSVSAQFGAKTVVRNVEDSEDQVTLDPVIFHSTKKIEKLERKKYDIIVTLQPTSPLLTVESLDKGLTRIINDETIHTVISVVNDTHLSWRIDQGKPAPNYKKRANRQELPPVFRTGFLITRSNWVTESSRIGSNVTCKS